MSDRNERMYVHKVIPFIVDGVPYFEMVLIPAYDSTSKFDRFIVYSRFMIPSHYAIKAAILIPLEKPIRVDGRKTAHSVSDSKTFNHVARYQNERDIIFLSCLRRILSKEKINSLP